MRELGYTVATWNVDSNDWRVVGTAKEPEAFVPFQTATSKPGAATGVGHMSLQHDIHLFSVRMVPKIIQTIKAAGIKLVTVDQCGMPAPAYRDGVNPAALVAPTATPAVNASIASTPAAAVPATTAQSTTKPTTIAAAKTSNAKNVLGGFLPILIAGLTAAALPYF
jgi:hypothetical protein